LLQICFILLQKIFFSNQKNIFSYKINLSNLKFTKTIKNKRKTTKIIDISKITSIIISNTKIYPTNPNF